MVTYPPFRTDVYPNAAEISVSSPPETGLGEDAPFGCLQLNSTLKQNRTHSNLIQWKIIIILPLEDNNFSLVA